MTLVCLSPFFPSHVFLAPLVMIAVQYWTEEDQDYVHCTVGIKQLRAASPPLSRLLGGHLADDDLILVGVSKLSLLWVLFYMS